MGRRHRPIPSSRTDSAIAEQTPAAAARINSTKQQICSLVQQAIFNGSSLDLPCDGLQNTLLHLAVQHDMYDCVGRLLSAGASIRVRNAEGVTACDIAINNGNQILSQLLSKREEYCQYMLTDDAEMVTDERLSFVSTSSSKSTQEESPNMTIAFTIGSVYEDYCDWNDSSKAFYLRELIEQQRSAEKQNLQELRSLSMCKANSVRQLNIVTCALRDQSHALSLKLWDSVCHYRETKKALDSVATDALAIKRQLAVCEQMIYWSGDVEVRTSSGLIFEKWRRARLVITGSMLLVQIDSNLVDAAKSDEDQKVPFFSMSTGPIRRQFRRGKRAIRMQLRSKRDVAIEINQLCCLTVSKTSQASQLDKELLFQYTADTDDSFRDRVESASSSDSQRSGIDFSLPSADSFARTRSSTRSTKSLRLRLIDGQSRKDGSGQKYISSSDNVARVIKTLKDSVRVVCQLDGRVYDYDLLQKSIDDGNELKRSQHLRRRATHDSTSSAERRFVPGSDSSCGSPSLSIFSPRTSQRTTRASMSQSSSSGMTSVESIATIASLTRPPLDGIEEEDRCSNLDSCDDVDEMADKVTRHTLCECSSPRSDRLISPLNVGACDDMAIIDSRKKERQTARLEAQYLLQWSKSVASDVSLVPRLRNLLVTSRRRTKALNAELCEAVTARETLRESLLYISALISLAESAPASTQFSPDMLLSLIQLYKDQVDRETSDDTAANSTQLARSPVQKSAFLEEMTMRNKSFSPTSPSFFSGSDAKRSHAENFRSSRSPSLSEAVQFVRKMTGGSFSDSIHSSASKSSRGRLSSMKEESSLCSSFMEDCLANEKSCCLLDLFRDVVREARTERLAVISSRALLGAPNSQFRTQFDEVMKIIEQMRSYDMDSFHTGERLAQCLVQRENSWKQLNSVRQKEYSFSVNKVNNESAELFDVEI